MRRRHWAASLEDQPQDVSYRSDVRCRHNQQASGTQSSMSLGQEPNRFMDVLDHLVRVDPVGDPVIEWQSGIEVRLDELPAGRTYLPFVDGLAIDIEAKRGSITRADLVQPASVAAAEVDHELPTLEKLIDAPRLNPYLSHVLKITRRKPSP